MEAVDLKKIRKSLFGLPTTKVSRSLFGEVDHDEVKRDLEREYKELLDEKTKLWNFNFERYQPRVDTESKLKWIPYSSPVTEHSIKSQSSLITSSTSCQTIDYTSRFQRPADANLPKKIAKSPCVNNTKSR
uniref:Cyclin-dependent kinase inhibitor domain-containing protein n=1 Tax=Clytia hemisphaerica TaxID=252671 RepID=A0A7M5WLJ9_9CNID